MKLNDEQLKIVKDIEERLNATTIGKWVAGGLPYNDCDDPWIETEYGDYVAQTVYDMQSCTQKHNIEEDTIFIAKAKDDIKYLLDIIRGN